MTTTLFEQESRSRTCSYLGVIHPDAPALWARLDELDKRLTDKIHQDETGCWVWLAAADQRYGYGYLSRGNRVQYAHRWIYELLVGPIGEGLHLDHLCRRPACVNPLHLEPVTPQVNSQRAGNATRARRTNCSCGEPFSTYPTGKRFCRACRNRKAREKYAVKGRRR